MKMVGGENGEWLTSAIAVLGKTEERRLAERQWERVSQIFQQIEAAVASGQDLAVKQAITDLDRVGYFRAVPARSTEAIPMPAPLRERFAELIHTLQARPAAGDDADPEQRLPDEQTGAAQ